MSTTTPSVVVEEVVEGKKKEGTLFGPYFPPLVPPIISISLSLFPLCGYHPNADYPPRCPTQVTHHPSFAFHPFSSLPNTPKIFMPKPGRSDQNIRHRAPKTPPFPLPHAAQWAPSQWLSVVTKCCCCFFLLSPVCVLRASCVPVVPTGMQKRKKEQKKKIL